MKSFILVMFLFWGVSAMAYSEAEEFGTFSVNLGVSNIAASQNFYEKLGFLRVHLHVY